MWLIFIGVMVLWTLANLVFAFVDPPQWLERFVPSKIYAVFGFLPEPWDRRIGMLANAGLGGFFLYLCVRYMPPG
jgi:hypothetical protein